MANKTKNKQKRTLDRLLHDDKVHSQLGDTLSSTRDLVRRATGRPPAEAVQDKKLYGHLRSAATSLTQVIQRLQAKPEPKPRSWLLPLGALAAGGLLLAKRKRKHPTDEPVRAADMPSAATPVSDPTTSTAA